jgi:hypothetical protein
MKPELRRDSVAMSPLRGQGIPSWNSDGSDSRSLIVLVPLFFICCFVIYFLLEITLIPLLVASQWIVLLGTVSFILLYLLHKRLRFDLTDGLILSIFGLAPLLMACMLTVNWYFSTPVEETYDIEAIIRDDNRVEVILSDNAYGEFYRIRLFDAEEFGRPQQITFFFGEGALGWKVKREHRF